MSQINQQRKNKQKNHDRISQLERRVDYLEERFSQVEHLAIWDTSNGEVISVADWTERYSHT